MSVIKTDNNGQIRMKKLAFLSILFSGLLFSRPSHALVFDWSFTTWEGATGGAGQLVTGTISGLEEGNNLGAGLNVAITSGPDSSLLGGGWTFNSTTLGGTAFDISGGSVIFADAVFYRFGMSERLAFGGWGGAFPEASTTTTDYWTNTGSTSFSLAPESVPEPSTLMLLGLALPFLLLVLRVTGRPSGVGLGL